MVSIFFEIQNKHNTLETMPSFIMLKHSFVSIFQLVKIGFKDNRILFESQLKIYLQCVLIINSQNNPFFKLLVTMAVGMLLLMQKSCMQCFGVYSFSSPQDKILKYFSLISHSSRKLVKSSLTGTGDYAFFIELSGNITP